MQQPLNEYDTVSNMGNSYDYSTVFLPAEPPGKLSSKSSVTNTTIGLKNSEALISAKKFFNTASPRAPNREAPANNSDSPATSPTQGRAGFEIRKPTDKERGDYIKGDYRSTSARSFDTSEPASSTFPSPRVTPNSRRNARTAITAHRRNPSQSSDDSSTSPPTSQITPDQIPRPNSPDRKLSPARSYSPEAHHSPEKPQQEALRAHAILRKKPLQAPSLSESAISPPAPAPVTSPSRTSFPSFSTLRERSNSPRNGIPVPPLSPMPNSPHIENERVVCVECREHIGDTDIVVSFLHHYYHWYCVRCHKCNQYVRFAHFINTYTYQGSYLVM